jgi:hypothetical protein
VKPELLARLLPYVQDQPEIAFLPADLWQACVEDIFMRKAFMERLIPVEQENPRFNHRRSFMYKSTKCYNDADTKPTTDATR